MLSLYTVFHLNILYSSIPEKEWPALVNKCYWPLLRMADELEIPVGVSENSFLWMEVLNSILSFPIDDHKIHHQLVEVNYVGV
mgnify:CR=1 FL=1